MVGRWPMTCLVRLLRRARGIRARWDSHRSGGEERNLRGSVLVPVLAMIWMIIFDVCTYTWYYYNYKSCIIIVIMYIHIALDSVGIYSGDSRWDIVGTRIWLIHSTTMSLQMSIIYNVISCSNVVPENMYMCYHDILYIMYTVHIPSSTEGLEWLDLGTTRQRV